MKLETADSNPANDLRGYLNVVRRRKWSIGVIALIATGAALIASLRQTPIYEATAEVQVYPFDPGQALSGDYAFLQSMPSEVKVASAPQVGAVASDLVKKKGGDGVQTRELTVSNPPNTALLDFTYADPSPAAAQMGAQAYADAYIRYRDGRAQAIYEAFTTALQSRLTQFQQNLGSAQEQLFNAPAEKRQSIQNRINDIQSEISAIQARLAAVPAPYAGATQLIAPAVLPTSPSSPKPFRDGALGLMLGIALGFGVALVRERLDDRTADKDDLERAIRAPVIAVVPKIEGWRKKTTARLEARDAPMSIAAESYRLARANLEFMAATRDVKTLAVTSAHPGEGKSVTTANLAASLAQDDKRVVAISCDLRRPRLHEFFGLGNDPGLVQLLEGRASVREVAHRTDPGSLRVIASGSLPPNPAELLGSDAMGKLLHDLRAAADFIILDTPPVLAVSDALMLARLTDGVIVVADASSTTRSALAQTCEQLEQVGSRIIGGIYNRFDASKSSAYYSGYRGKYYAQREPSVNGRSEAELTSGNGDLRTSAEDEVPGTRR